MIAAEGEKKEKKKKEEKFMAWRESWRGEHQALQRCPARKNESCGKKLLPEGAKKKERFPEGSCSPMRDGLHSYREIRRGKKATCCAVGISQGKEERRKQSGKTCAAVHRKNRVLFKGSVAILSSTWT